LPRGEGKYTGRASCEELVEQFCDKHKLDKDARASGSRERAGEEPSPQAPPLALRCASSPVGTKLIQVMAKREQLHGCDVKHDLRELDNHLMSSSKPSALVPGRARRARSRGVSIVSPVS